MGEQRVFTPRGQLNLLFSLIFYISMVFLLAGFGLSCYECENCVEKQVSTK
jgi:hypothetical protein